MEVGGWGLRVVHFSARLLGLATPKLAGRLPHPQAHSQQRRKGRQGTLKYVKPTKTYRWTPLHVPCGWVGVRSRVCQHSTRRRVGGSGVVDPPHDKATRKRERAKGCCDKTFAEIAIGKKFDPKLLILLYYPPKFCERAQGAHSNRHAEHSAVRPGGTRKTGSGASLCNTP